MPINEAFCKSLCSICPSNELPTFNFLSSIEFLSGKATWGPRVGVCAHWGLGLPGTALGCPVLSQPHGLGAARRALRPSRNRAEFLQGRVLGLGSGSCNASPEWHN